jgi:LysR family transcriptional regulator for bpeEF and oprC
VAGRSLDIDQIAAIRAFVRIVETGSFTQAARTLAMPKATITKHIQLLEAHLRAKLLSRTTRRMAVTVDGAAYYERAVRLLAELDELDSTVTASQALPKGRLRVDLSVPIAQSVIIPALSDFQARYPDIQLELGVSDRRSDLVAENVDCVLRGGDVVDQSLIARRIAELHMITCASPAYLAGAGTPQTPDDLMEAPNEVVTYFNATTGQLRPFQFERDGEKRTIAGRHHLAINEISTYAAAGLAGHGIVQLTWFMARAHLEQGTLVRVLADWHVPSIPLFVVYPPNRHLSNKLRVFVDWAARLFATEAFTGKPPMPAISPPAPRP